MDPLADIVVLAGDAVQVDVVQDGALVPGSGARDRRGGLKAYPYKAAPRSAVSKAIAQCNCGPGVYRHAPSAVIRAGVQILFNG